LQETLADLLEAFGDRQICIAAEMTKMYERFFRGSLSEALGFYKDEPARGEFTIVVAGAQPESGVWSEERVKEALGAEVTKNQKPSQLARKVAGASGWTRSAVYDLIQKINKETK
jgi:16S rRNA (cytidine1402-2'-O)-methyltransferase